MKRIRNTQGITLVAMVITIIVLLILVGVTIIMLMGENGLIAKAQSAKVAQEVAEGKEQIEMGLLDAKSEQIINNTGTTNVGEYLKTKGIIETYQTKEDGILEVITAKKYKYRIDINNKVEYIGKVVIVPDLTEENITFDYAPRTYTDGIVTVSLFTIVKGYTLQYSIDGITWNTYTTAIQVTTNRAIYARLWDGVSYGGAATFNVSTIDKTAPNLTISTTNTTNSITVTAEGTDDGETETGIIIYYFSKDDGIHWIRTDNRISTYKFENLIQGQEYKIKVKVEDHSGKTTTKAVTVTTGAVPNLTVANTTFTYTPSTWTNANVKVGITTTVDLKYYYDETTYGYYSIQYSVDGTIWTAMQGSEITLGINQPIYVRLWDGTNYGGTATANITNIDKTAPIISVTQNTGTTTRLIVNATDTESGINKIQYNNAGTWEDLTTTNIENGKTATKTVLTTGTYTFRTIDIVGNSKQQSITVSTVAAQVNAPVLGTGMTPIKWNGTAWVTTNSSDTDWYSYVAQTSDAGINKWANAQTADGSMWVWVPRYAYKITSGYHTSTAGTIDVKFLNGTTDTAYDGASCTRTSATDTYYTVHPCFTNNTSLGGWDKELKGIWVAKFEASNTGSNTIQIKPGISSWRSTKASDIFSYMYNYNRTLESHLIKNSEWGAVAYLAQSKYGRNGTEVTVNTSSSCYTGGGTGTAYTTNVAQSTTKNVYGIYDMSGGTYEYTASYFSGYSSNTYFSNVTNAAPKYKHVYSSYASSNYGDAIYETSYSNSGSTSWNLDYAYFVSSSFPYFIRGGVYDNGSAAGLFYFNVSDGNSYSVDGFRGVLVI